MPTRVLYFASDNAIYLLELVNTTTKALINDATVTAKLLDSTGTPVVGSSISLTSLGSGGNYRGILDDAVTDDLTVGATYKVEVIATKSGSKRRWAIDHTVRED